MPRPKTLPDERVWQAALSILHDRGPDALTFQSLSAACGLSAAALVQRFGSKARLKQRTLLHAWDRLDEHTARLAADAPRTPEGAIALLVGLSAPYGGIEAFAEGLLVLREDLRDPVLRARGARWQQALSGVLDECFSGVPGLPEGIGLLAATQWQGALLWWSFDPQQPVTDHVERALRRFVAALRAPGAGDR